MTSSGWKDLHRQCPEVWPLQLQILQPEASLTFNQDFKSQNSKVQDSELNPTKLLALQELLLSTSDLSSAWYEDFPLWVQKQQGYILEATESSQLIGHILSFPLTWSSDSGHKVRAGFTTYLYVKEKFRSRNWAMQLIKGVIERGALVGIQAGLHLVKERYTPQSISLRLWARPLDLTKLEALGFTLPLPAQTQPTKRRLYYRLPQEIKANLRILTLSDYTFYRSEIASFKFRLDLTPSEWSACIQERPDYRALALIEEGQIKAFCFLRYFILSRGSRRAKAAQIVLWLGSEKIIIPILQIARNAGAVIVYGLEGRLKTEEYRIFYCQELYLQTYNLALPSCSASEVLLPYF